MPERLMLIVGASAVVGTELRVVPNAVVAMAGGVIAGVGPASEVDVPVGAHVVEAPGQTLIPGFIDAHVHIGFFNPHDVLAGGVTTARDLAWPPDVIFDLATSSRSQSFDGPEVLTAGPMITVPNGYPMGAGWAPPDTGLPVRGSEEARLAVREIAGRGAAVIKVAVNSAAGPVLGLAELSAIVDEAHDLALNVTGHVHSLADLDLALNASLDELAHMVMSAEEIPGGVIEQMVSQGMAVVPTLGFRAGSGKRTAIRNLERFIRAGGRVVYGTDLGNGGVRPGIEPTEVRLMAKAGMSALDILHSATVGSARWLGLTDRGVIAPGMKADLVLLDTQELRDASDLTKVAAVWRGGHRVDR